MCVHGTLFMGSSWNTTQEYEEKVKFLLLLLSCANDGRAQFLCDALSFLFFHGFIDRLYTLRTRCLSSLPLPFPHFFYGTTTTTAAVSMSCKLLYVVMVRMTCTQSVSFVSGTLSTSLLNMQQTFA